jgi:hypothetical protein
LVASVARSLATVVAKRTQRLHGAWESRRTKRRKPTAEASAGAVIAESVERRAGAKGNMHQQSTYWAQNQGRVSKALARIRQLVPSHTQGRAVRGKAARTDLGGGRAMKRTSLPLHRRKFMLLLGGTTGWPIMAGAQQRHMRGRAGL